MSQQEFELQNKCKNTLKEVKRLRYGFAPKYYKNVLTKQGIKFLAAGSPLTQDLVRGF